MNREFKWLTVFSSLPMQVYIGRAIKIPLRDALVRLLGKPLNMFELIHILLELNRIKKLVLKLPEPTKENTWRPTSHTLIEVRDEFFAHLDMPSREKELRAIWNFGIIINDYDIPYRHLINRAVEIFREKEWVIDDPGEPKQYWKENINGNKGTQS